MAMKSSRQPRFSFVFFDLESTGLGATDEITQIGSKCGDASYNRYVIPTVPIPKEITEMTGISITDKQMYCHGKPVDAVAAAIAAETFINFLETIGGDVILVSHNCFKSGGPWLVRLMKKQGMIWRFKNIVHGFSDSWPLLKQRLPATRKTGQGFNLVQLAREFLGYSSGSHDAIKDATMLEKLMVHPKIRITPDDIINTHQTVDIMIQRYKCRLY